ncbi:FitA-like ribbon-helix-helix domain-containing protein [Cellulomonas iranensis]|uniref:Plasmid stability protein n=1 Tax=Cellulomonas iranensis TaxID=76862 RepID=A0ABU0GLE0_9CELL|nr:hypothetical protein [Cellulomonas iranensis]MDQ0425541.1 plasmid stability protein [Cellulomonas iranensis]UCN14961.1 hypothetical protein LFM56_01125 [Cellulomonas iranensis]
MSVSLTVRDVPDDVRDELAARAARSGRSLQEYLRATLTELASHPSAADALATARGRARSYPDLTAQDVLDDLDAGRR